MVNSYTVAIACEGYNAQMVLKIDDSSGTPRINELSVRPLDGVSLSAQDLPNIDLELLLRSLQQPPAAAESTGKRKIHNPGRAVDEQRSLGDAGQLTPITGHPQVLGTPGTGRAGMRKATANAVVTMPPAAAGERPRRRTRTTTQVGAARIYRRMPDDLAEVYASVGSVSAVARHYGVPRHTAQGWIGRLRRQD